MFLFYEGKDKKKEEYLEKARRQSVSVRRRISVAVFIVQPWRGNLEDTSGRIYFRPYVRTRAQSRERAGKGESSPSRAAIPTRRPSIDRSSRFIPFREEGNVERRKEGRDLEFPNSERRKEGRDVEFRNLERWKEGKKRSWIYKFGTIEGRNEKILNL